MPAMTVSAEVSVEQARAAAEVLGGVVSERFPWVDGMGPVTEDRDLKNLEHRE